MRLLLLTILIVIAYSPASFASDRFLDIQEVVAENGLKAWLVEDHSLPIVSLQFSFLGAGSKNETPDKQGTTRLLSNMLDEGAGELTSQEFQKQLADHSISLSFSSGRDHFGGSVKTLTRNKDKAFELLELALKQPRFDQEPLERMKAANISRIRSSLSDPDWIAARLQNELIYKGHPYAQNSGGTIGSLTALSQDDLKNFKDTYLTRDRLVIAVSGNITADELKNVLNEVFSDLKAAENNDKKKKVITPETGLYVFDKDIPQTLIEISFPAFDRKDPDYYALQVFNYIFGGGGFGSRLMEEVREKQGLTYGIYSYFTTLDESQKFYISTSTQNDKAETVLNIIQTEIDKVLDNAVTAEELSNAKKYLIGSLPLSLTSTNKISGIALSLQKNKREITYLDEYADKIEKVTQEDIQRVAKRILQTEAKTTLLVGQPSNLKAYKTLTEIPNVE